MDHYSIFALEKSIIAFISQELDWLDDVDAVLL